ncbi:MAG: conjugative transfer signal peptidase TraF [Rhizobiales bacterium]|nr:conjugative transfer signal peptidase TraF [Hyphomicrobiales bacterium]
MRPRPVMSVLGLGAAALAGIAGLGWIGGFRLNATPSYPLGLWRIERIVAPIKVGDLVFICMPASAGLTLGLTRGYLRPGLCPGGAGPLIKTVAALPRAHVEVGWTVTIDGGPLGNSRVSPVDAEGRALAAYAGGIVPPGHLYLHSDYAGSYDSRYFGPLPDTGLLGLARPVATFDP